MLLDLTSLAMSVKSARHFVVIVSNFGPADEIAVPLRYAVTLMRQPHTRPCPRTKRAGKN
jgi:hypothetical protein